MDALLLAILEKLSNQQVSLNPQGEICVGDVCRSAYDWLKSIIALENSDSDEMMAALKCVRNTPNIEKKIEKIAFLQCNSTTCWAATAVMLAKYYDSSIKYNNEREYLESKCPSPLEKNAAKNMCSNINIIINRLIQKVRIDSGYGSELDGELQNLKTDIGNIFLQDTLSRDDVARVWYLFRSNTLVMNAIKTFDDVRNMYYIEMNNSWFQYYAEAFYDPENRKGDTTLAPGLQLNQVDDWFKGMMKFDIDKFDGNNRRLNEFTLQYLAEKLLNGPVIINMPSEIIEEVMNCDLPVKPCLQEGMDISDCVLCAMKGYTLFDPYNDGTHYVMFYGMELPEQEKEVYCQYVETIYYDNKSELICDGNKKFRHHSISWVTLQTWMTQHYKEKLKHDPFVIYKETNK